MANKSIKSLFFILVIGLFFIGIARNSMVFTNKESKNVATSAQSHSIVEDYNNEIWQLLEPYTITQDSFEQLYDQHAQAYKRHIAQAQHQMPGGKPLSSKTTNTITQICNDFSIPMDSITIVPYIDDSISPACVIDTMLFVDEELLQQFPKNAQYFVLGHELQHVRFKDHFLGYIAEHNMPHITKQINHPFNRLHRLQELRADSATITHSKVYADGHQEFLKNILTMHGEGKGITHPTIATRLALNAEVKTSGKAVLA